MHDLIFRLEKVAAGERVDSMSKCHRSTGHCVRITDGQTTDTIYLVAPRQARSRWSRTSVYFQIQKDRSPTATPPRFFQFTSPNTVCTSFASEGDHMGSVKFSDPLTALFPSIRQAVSAFEARWVAQKLARPLKGIPLLNESLTRRGYFITSFKARYGSVRFTIAHRDVTDPADMEGNTSLSGEFSLGSKSIYFRRQLDKASRGKIMITTKTVKDEMEEASPEGFFSTGFLRHIQMIEVAEALAA